MNNVGNILNIEKYVLDISLQKWWVFANKLSELSVSGYSCSAEYRGFFFVFQSILTEEPLHDKVVMPPATVWVQHPNWECCQMFYYKTAIVICLQQWSYFTIKSAIIICVVILSDSVSIRWQLFFSCFESADIYGPGSTPGKWTHYNRATATLACYDIPHLLILLFQSRLKFDSSHVFVRFSVDRCLSYFYLCAHQRAFLAVRKGWLWPLDWLFSVQIYDHKTSYIYISQSCVSVNSFSRLLMCFTEPLLFLLTHWQINTLSSPRHRHSRLSVCDNLTASRTTHAEASPLSCEFFSGPLNSCNILN